MPQINLLKENRATDLTFWRVLLAIANKVMIGLIVLLVAYYGWLIYSTKKAARESGELEQQITSKKTAIFKSVDRQELVTRQGQLAAVKDIISQHPYWSAVLPKLGFVMLKKARSVSFRTGEEATLEMSLQVPSVEDLDKLLQVFDYPEYNRYFYNIRIGSISNEKKKDQLTTRFDLRMNYAPDLLKYEATASGR